MLEPSVSMQLAEAASLMLVGMLVVFVFLTILICAVNVLSWLCKRFPEHIHEHSITPTMPTEAVEQGIPPHHVAAISAAFLQRKNKH